MLNSIKIKMNLIVNLFIFVIITQFSFSQRLTKEDCKCKLYTNKRIIGGQNAVKNSIPFMVSLADPNFNNKYFFNHSCGAALISHEFVITAAHCVDSYFHPSPKSLTVRVGLHYLNETNLENRTYAVERIYVDPHYLRGKDAIGKVNRGDFALLKLAGKVPFSRTVQPACLPQKFEHYDDKQKFLAVGWGVMERPKIYYRRNETHKSTYGGPSSKILKQAYFKYDKCSLNNGYLDHQICIDPIKKGDSPCYHDSGSPMIYQKPNSPYAEVIGLTSNSEGLRNETEFVDYYCTGKSGMTRISHFMPLVNFITKGNYCKI